MGKLRESRVYYKKRSSQVDRLYGLGTDGAAVMTGRLNGVAKQLPDSFPKPVSVACAAHRLALACKDASNAVRYMAHFRNHLQQVKDTRWLLQDRAVQNLQRNLPAMLGALTKEVSTRKCPVAKGLYTFCATYRFVAALYLQAEVLPHIAMLSKVFQRADVNFLHIKEQAYYKEMHLMLPDATVIQEWTSYKHHVLVGSFKEQVQVKCLAQGSILYARLPCLG
ncbi:hypothetical protein CgunFtcFv8_015035 [Champsocephalus gunnari]|uniref:Zinc finger protein 862 n=2 Tax=Champsocephalus TaxID=52236 RepID=A0AAN8I0K4_CHAGU|nr:hypothetical protein CgunFtcFv8_015035 [Champsocephalus gunnari]